MAGSWRLEGLGYALDGNRKIWNLAEMFSKKLWDKWLRGPGFGSTGRVMVYSSGYGQRYP